MTSLMSGEQFQLAQAASDSTSTAATDNPELPCCIDCDPAKALSFKQGLPTKRVRIQTAPSNTSNKQQWVTYQTRKCGNLEYNIHDYNFVMDFASEIYYELDPRSSIWADGLAHTPPVNAHPAYKFGCCLLEAKYSQPDRSQAFYIRQSEFVGTRERKWWLKMRYQAYKDREIIQGIFGRRLGRRKPRKTLTFKQYAQRIWLQARAKAVLQLAAYARFCMASDIPYTRYLVICGEQRFVYSSYFLPIATPPGQVVYSPLFTNDWRT